MQKGEKKRPGWLRYLKEYGISLGASILALCTWLMVCAVLLEKGVISRALCMSAAMFGLLAAGFLGGLVLIRQGRGKALQKGLVFAAALILLRLCALMAIQDGGIFTPESLWGMLCCLIGSLFGVMLGSKKRKKRRR